MKYAVEIKSNLESAVAHLQAANAALANSRWDAAAAHAAESAFDTATVLLLDEEIEPARHGDVITLIHQIFVNGRRLTREQGANLDWLCELRRNVRDGLASPVPAEQAHRAVEFAGRFLDAAKVILEA